MIPAGRFVITSGRLRLRQLPDKLPQGTDTQSTRTTYEKSIETYLNEMNFCCAHKDIYLLLGQDLTVFYRFCYRQLAVNCDDSSNYSAGICPSLSCLYIFSSLLAPLAYEYPRLGYL